MGLDTFLPEGLQGLQLPVLAATAVGVSGALCLYSLLGRSKGSKRGTDCPSPPGYPILGHLPYMMSSSFHRVMAKWTNEFGGIFKVNMAGTTFIVSDAELASHVLTARGEAGRCLYHKAPQIYEPSFEISYDHPSIFSDCEDGTFHHTWRKAMAACFSTENMKAVFPAVRGCTEKMVTLWKGLPDGVPVDGEMWMTRCLLDIIGAAGFDIAFNALDGQQNEMLSVVHETLIAIHRRMLNPLLKPMHKYLPFLPQSRKANNAVARFRAIFSQILKDFRARGPPSAEDNRMIWGAIASVKDPATGKAYPDDVVAGQIATMLVAGFDTTSYTCLWALYDIARHPGIQRRIAQELADAGLLQVQGRPPARQLEWADLTALPYFNMVLKESMRLHPVGAGGSGRVAPADMTLGGVFVPAGSKLWVPIYAVHVSEQNFSEPTAFDPERWRASPDSKPDKASGAAAAGAAACPFAPAGARATHTGNAAAPTKSLIPFSDGPRNCVGMSFAYVSARCCLLAILSNFWLDLTPELRDHEAVEKAQFMALVLTSGLPLKFQLRPHTTPTLEQ